MSALRLLVPAILTIQFLLVLVALVSAMLFAEPQITLPSKRKAQPVNARRRTGLRG